MKRQKKGATVGAKEGVGAASAPPAGPPVLPSFPATHKYTFDQARSYSVCRCGAEQDMVVRAGAALRLYRKAPKEAWAEAIGPCPKSAGVIAPPSPAPAPPPPRAASTAVAGLESALRKQFPAAFEPELIDGYDVEQAAKAVMLDVAFSPVLDRRDARIPVDAVALGDGSYRVFRKEKSGAGQPIDVSAESLRVMRARFLLVQGAAIRRLPTMDPEQRQWVEKTFFPRGDVPWVPPAGSPLAEQAWTGEPIVIPREGDGEVDIVAVFRALATPGGAVPAVCPVLAPPRAPEGAA